MKGLLHFDVTDLNVTVEEGVKITWQGKEIDSGRLTITLGEPGSKGVIDYEKGMVKVEFRVRISSPALDELFDILEDMGADRGVTAPFDAVIRSQGSVFDDHSLRLAGKGEIAEHRLFNPDETKIDILAPTY
ncbi:MAG: hypothetical protein AB1489_01285 [Acidobacteriota bacterium]